MKSPMYQERASVSPSYAFPGAPATSPKDLLYRVAQDKISQAIMPPKQEMASRWARDITDNMYASPDLYAPLKQSMSEFSRSYFQQKIPEVKGNLTELTRQARGVTDPAKVNTLRKNIYRQMEQLDLWSDVKSARPEDSYQASPQQYDSHVQARNIEQTITSSLSDYRSELHPQDYSSLKERVQSAAPELADSLAQYAPSRHKLINNLAQRTKDMSFDEAKQEAEKEFILQAHENANFKKRLAAEYLQVSKRTLDRKIKKLGIKEEIERRRRGDTDKPKPAPVFDMDHFRKLRQQKQKEHNKQENAQGEDLEYYLNAA
ncbi:helix-turn-helix domain-containing protein [Nanoarchaeota archaeon]